MLFRSKCVIRNMLQIVSVQFSVSQHLLTVFLERMVELDACRVFHSFLFLSLVAKPDPHHVLFEVQLFCDSSDFL